MTNQDILADFDEKWTNCPNNPTALFGLGDIQEIRLYIRAKIKEAEKEAVNRFIKKQALVVTKFSCGKHPKAIVVPQCQECQKENHLTSLYEIG